MSIRLYQTSVLTILSDINTLCSRMWFLPTQVMKNCVWNYQRQRDNQKWMDWTNKKKRFRGTYTYPKDVYKVITTLEIQPYGVIKDNQLLDWLFSIPIKGTVLRQEIWTSSTLIVSTIAWVSSKGGVNNFADLHRELEHKRLKTASNSFFDVVKMK